MNGVFLSIIFLTLSVAVSAAIPFETPYYSIGSDFLAADGECWYLSSCPSESYPKINTLFDNTKIYLDNNNDGVWDYSFSGNAGEYITLNPVIEPPRFGARISQINLSRTISREEESTTITGVR